MNQPETEIRARVQEALTSTYHEFRFLTPEECPATLSAALTEKLPHLASDSWEERIRFGGTYVNGQLVSDDIPLSAPVRIEYFEPKFDISRANDFFPAFSDTFVLYQDDDLIACFKPAGLPSIANREQNRFHMRKFVEQHVGHQVHLPSRLDTGTQGVMLMSTSRKMHGRLQRLFERRLITKHYLLQVPKRIEWQERSVDAAIGRSKLHSVLRELAPDNGQSALTDFRKEDASNDGTILSAFPRTGRTHQIRVHCQAFGPPIIGDRFYGGTSAPELRLLSYRVSLWHPLKQEELCIEVPEALLPEWVQSRPNPIPCQ